MSQIPKTPPKEHGTISTYNNHRCRCDKCRAGNTAWMKRRRTDRIAGIPATKNGVDGPGTHNAWTYTNWGCRCDICREASRQYQNQRRAK